MNQSEAEDLFVLTGQTGQIQRQGSELRLTLRAPGRSVLQFTDRPLRDAERLTVRDLVDRWEGLGFAQDPPNAALAVAGTPGDETLALTLTAPRIGDADTVQFTARVLRNGDSPMAKPRELGAASLFIDPSGSTTSDAGAPACGTTGEIVLVAGEMKFVPKGMVVGNTTYRKADFPALARLVGARFGATGSTDDFITPGLKAIDSDANVGGQEPDATPRLPLHVLVCADGTEPTPAPASAAATTDEPDGCTVGEVRFTGLAARHAGWMRAEGQTLDTDDYPMLAATLGTTYGGDPGETVRLPDVDVPAITADVAPDAQICVHGTSQAQEKPACIMNSIRLFAGKPQEGTPASVAPTGQMAAVTTNTALFSLFGVTYGGNGRTTFGMPNVARAPSGLRWALCLQGSYPQHADVELDPSPQAGVVAPLTPLPPCGGTFPGLLMMLELQFDNWPPPDHRKLTARLQVERISTTCQGQVRSFELQLPGEDNKLVITRKTRNDPGTPKEEVVGRFLLAGEDAGMIRPDWDRGATGSIAVRLVPEFCQIIDLDAKSCTGSDSTTSGTFRISPALDDVGLLELWLETDR